MNRNLRHIIVFVFALALSTGLAGQDRIEVSGLIRGINKTPIAGASVAVEGIPTTPVITDSTGSFLISVPNLEVTLFISPMGAFKAKKVFLNGRNYLEITLTPDDLPDGQDLATYIFTDKEQRDFSSAAVFPETEILHRQSDPSLDSYFKGIVPGMWSTGMSGMPGSGNVSYIRGIKSMFGNTQPLYVIDGLPLDQPGTMESLLDGNAFNSLAFLNPSDITDITIEKDYLNAPLYGVRGSNGIIYIETMKPTEVETMIDVSLKTGLTTAPEQLPQLNAAQYRTYAKDVLMTSGQPEETFRDNYPGLYASPGDPNYNIYGNDTDWQNQVFRNAFLYDLYLRILGGDEIARYGLSVGYLNKQGVVDQSNFNRFSVRFVGSFNMFSWLRFNVSSSLSSNQSTLKESARVDQTSPVLSGLAKNPLMIPYQFDEEDNQLQALQDVDELGVSNPLAIIQNFNAINRSNRFLSNFKIEADISNSFKFNTLIGINFSSLNEDIFMPNLGMEFYYNDEAYNVAKSISNYFFAFSNHNYFSYNKDLGLAHSIRAHAGLNINSNKFQSDWGVAKNSHESDEYRDLQSGTANLNEQGGSNGKWNRMSLYANLAYSFKERYSVILNISGESSTRIGPEASNANFIYEVPFGLFYSAGISWRISNESFMKEIGWIEDLKLRMNYGKTGNDDIGNYNAFNYFYLTHYRSTTGAVPGPMVDESLTYEANSQFTAGLDFTSRGSRLRLSLDYFKHKTEDLFLQYPQNYYMGHEYLPINSGSLQNTGWEGQLSGRIIQSGNFLWDLSLSVGTFANQVLEIEGGEIITPFLGGAFLSKEGEALLNFYGYEYEGVYASAQQALDANLSNKDGIKYGAGDAIYRDISGPEGVPDSRIDDHDKTIIGSPLPDYFGGIGTRFQYKRWSLNADFQWVYGKEVFNYLRYQNEKMTGLSNQSTAVMNRWSNEGQQTNIPRALWDDPTGNSDFSTRWIEDGSYMKLKNLTLGYLVPDKFWVFKNAEFYISATNLFVLSSYLGYDPEFSFSYQTMEQGIDYGKTPFSKTFMLGIKLGL